MPSNTRKQPQDRKPKATDARTFVGADGKTWTLPAPTEALKKMTGRDIRDALLGDAQQEASLGFRILERCDPAPELLDALYDLPAAESVEIIGRWMPSPDGEGTTLPQS